MLMKNYLCKVFFNVSFKLLNRMVSLEKVRWMRNTLLVGNILTGFRIGTYLETVRGRGGFAEIFGEIKKYHTGEIEIAMRLMWNLQAGTCAKDFLNSPPWVSLARNLI